MKKPIKIVLIILVVLIFASFFMGKSALKVDVVPTENSIAILDMSGQIFDSKEFIENMELLKKNSFIKGVIIRIDSPGGAVNPSMQMYEFTRDFGKPVYAAMGSVAASGGYLLSLGAKKIYAEPSTITGSIGVIMNLVNTQELTDKIGLKNITLKTGQFKDSGSPSREFTEDDRKVLSEVMFDMYKQFTDIVVERRKLPEKEVLKLADGRIYTGNMAKKVKLVDEIGSWRKAFEDMKIELGDNKLKKFEVLDQKTFFEKLIATSIPTEIGKIINKETGFFYLSEIQ